MAWSTPKEGTVRMSGCKIGKTESDHHGQRKTYLIAAIIHEEARRGNAGRLQAEKGMSWSGWCAGAVLGDQQARNVTVVNYQDDLLILAVGPKAVADFNNAVPKVLEKELGLFVSTKSEASQPFGRVAEFIGARSDAT